ncbi:hypothetical protein NX722_17630 [Endozoicomonas gorgoniicola]|uniref:Uncharacterized protein n=1 Tax=Endozoicomonas gorgoniicola TaxID=1234144 RepID=A0ABT3MYE5_9GAMM|nr:hypothetical protein [Endozoicomonas gorgoniicola]MCW7554408.1 hypothetical protein [Endozoicomonas gorgoniicola]
MAKDYFYKMQITVPGKTSVFYVRSKNPLKHLSNHLLEVNLPQPFYHCSVNPASSFAPAITEWGRAWRLRQPEQVPEQIPRRISGAFPIGTVEEGTYILQPLPTLPPNVTETIEVSNNDMYHLLATILYRLRRQTYGRAQESLVVCWACNGASREASSGYTSQITTEQPSSIQELLDEWELTFSLTGEQWVSNLERLLEFTNNTLLSVNPMQLVSLTGSSPPNSLFAHGNREIIFRAYLPDSIASEYQARHALGLSDFDFPVALRRVSSQPSDAEDTSEKLEVTKDTIFSPAF